MGAVVGNAVGVAAGAAVGNAVAGARVGAVVGNAVLASSLQPVEPTPVHGTATQNAKEYTTV